MTNIIDSQLFKSWTDLVKEKSRLSITAISKRIGVTKAMILNYRNGVTPPTLSHFELLANEFPKILAEEAKAAGIEIKPKPEQDGEIFSRVKKILDKLEQDKNEFDRMTEQLEAYKEQLKAANRKQEEDAATIKRLLDMLEKKL